MSRVALVRASGNPAHPIDVLSYRKYACADYPGLAEILEDFLRRAGGVASAKARSPAPAMRWTTDRSSTSTCPGRCRCATYANASVSAIFRLVNDFEAVAHAAAHVDASEVLRLTRAGERRTGPDAGGRPGNWTRRGRAHSDGRPAGACSPPKPDRRR